MMKKGDIWISTVIYIALGIVILTLILNAGLPLINKMKDKNTILQTKELMFDLDKNIRTVVSEGPGSKRFLSPFEIRRGSLVINESEESITWQLKTKLKYMELSKPRKESSLELSENEVRLGNSNVVVKGEYLMSLKLDYFDDVNIVLDSGVGSQLSGAYSITIMHVGTYTENKPDVLVKVV